jgi:hypothetical protein
MALYQPQYVGAQLARRGKEDIAPGAVGQFGFGHSFSFLLQKSRYGFKKTYLLPNHPSSIKRKRNRLPGD